MNRTRLLLLEDDPASRAFLRDALAPLAVDVDVVTTCAQAAEVAARGDALWLFDAHLPDGDATGLLRELRARGLDTPALALTAEIEPSAHARLRDAGFARVLDKPINGDTLRRAVHEALPGLAGGDPWDDARALPALGGRAEALTALRALFLQDLPAQMARVRDAVARGDASATRAELHRLKGGCGFVGATGLLAAVSALDAQPSSTLALEAVLRHGARLLGDA